MEQGLQHKKSHEWDAYGQVIVFDGVCNFCNSFVNFVMDRDRQQKFKFGTLQSEPGQYLLEELQLPREDFETFLLLKNGRVFSKSTAALKIIRELDGIWPVLYALMVIPRPIRDTCYDFIARHRYRWMGKSTACRMPTAADRERFV